MRGGRGDYNWIISTCSQKQPPTAARREIICDYHISFYMKGIGMNYIIWAMIVIFALAAPSTQKASGNQIEIKYQILQILQDISNNLDESTWPSYYLDVTSKFNSVLRGDDVSELVRVMAQLDQKGEIAFNEKGWVDNNIYTLGIARPNLYYLKIDKNSFSRSLDLFIRIKYIYPNKYELLGARITRRA